MKKYLLTTVILSGFMVRALAQGCSVCSQNTAGLGNESATGLNNGILYLAALPLAFLITVGILWYRKNKNTI